MAERDSYTPGAFCWADVGSPDPEAAQEFYGSLFGWTAEVTPGGYWMLTLRGRNVAGMFALPEGWPPGWVSYVSVESADDTAARARELGAAVTIEPREVGPPEAQVGLMALLADPEGAAFALWQPGRHVGAGLVNEVGTMAWNQLATPDTDAARSFYAELFGWSYEQMEGGEPPYWNIRNTDGRLNGGLTGLPAEGVTPHWQVTFTVEDVPAAVGRTEELGGSVLQPPTPTRIGNIAVVQDPAGAAFGYFDGEPEP
jgi:uncharacterized protein